MTTIKTTLYIHKRLEPSDWEEEIEIWPRDVSVYEHNRGKLVVIGTHEVEVPIPDVDVTAQAIDDLNEEAERIMQEARAKVAELNERIARLRCLEHKPETQP